MRIGEFSERTGASPRSLRHYEKMGLISSGRLENGYRDFDETQVERVKAVRFLIKLGMKMDRIEGFLDCEKNPDFDEIEKNGLCEGVFLLEDRLREVNEQIEDLLDVKTRLEDNISLLRDVKAHSLVS